MIAAANEADIQHGKVSALNLNAANTNQLVFAEVANVLQKRMKDKSRVLAALSQIVQNMNIISVTEAEMLESLRLFAANYPKLSLTDCTLIVQSRDLDEGLLTFDDNLNRAFNH